MVVGKPSSQSSQSVHRPATTARQAAAHMGHPPPAIPSLPFPRRAHLEAHDVAEVRLRGVELAQALVGLGAAGAGLEVLRVGGQAGVAGRERGAPVLCAERGDGLDCGGTAGISIRSNQERRLTAAVQDSARTWLVKSASRSAASSWFLRGSRHSTLCSSSTPCEYLWRAGDRCWG